MKKIILPIILILMIAIAFASPLIPAPVKILVSINGQKISYSDTKVTNKYTGEVLTPKERPDLEIKDGFGQFDLSYFKQGYAVAQRGYVGDQIEVIACNVHPSCTNTFYLDSTEPRTILINIVDSSVVLPQPEIIEKPVEIIKEVPKETIVEKEIVKEVPIDETAKDPVSYLLGALIGLLASILGLFAWGKGFEKILKYWAKKDPQRAYKMAKTVVKNYKDGKYK